MLSSNHFLHPNQKHVLKESVKPVKKYCYAFVSTFCITALFFASVNCLFSCRICQDIFWRLHERGYISQDTVDQLQCQNCDRLEYFQLSILLLICTENVVVLDFHASSLIKYQVNHESNIQCIPYVYPTRRIQLQDEGNDG